MTDDELRPALARHGWDVIASVPAPPTLCDRCKATVPFGRPRCPECERAWHEWLRDSRKRIFV